MSEDAAKYIWRTVALTLLAIQLTALGGWLMFGLDSVKHSEIDGIMATRAPWNHDRPRIDGLINDLQRHHEDLEQRVRVLEQKMLGKP